MELLHSSDEALKTLVSEIDTRDRKTVLVFWGDHLPGVFGKLQESDRPDIAYETPFFIYANFETGTDVPLGVLSPNYIRTVVLDYIDAAKTPFDYLLDDVKADVPNLTLNSYTGEMGDAMLDYRLIEYDAVSGNGYAADMDFFNVP
jgi:phosphoglycerol transferase MdoB-like AlkP superfamily enzyme